MKEFISNTSQNLTPRDRVLLIVLVIAFTLTGTVYGAKAIYDKMQTLRNDISELKGDLKRLKTFQKEQESLRQNVAEGEAVIAKHKNTALSAFLETSAQKLKIKEKLSSVSPKGTSKNTYFQEKNYTVNLRNLSTEEMGRFLYDIENSWVNGAKERVRKLEAVLKNKDQKSDKEILEAKKYVKWLEEQIVFTKNRIKLNESSNQ